MINCLGGHNIMAHTVQQEARKDLEKGTRSAADLIGAAKADECVDLTDTPASPLRKRDSQGNPKAGGRLPFAHAKPCLQVASGCL